MNSFDVVLLAAGRGSRMQSLTDHVAKPSLDIGGDSLVSRLARQVNLLEGHKKTYVNLSYKPISIIDSLRNHVAIANLTFLWERRYMGTAWSLMKIFSRSESDLLVIHADLYLSDIGLANFVHVSQTRNSWSHVAVHNRKRAKARSIVELHKESTLIKSFQEVNAHQLEPYSSTDESTVVSNSGVYFFSREHLFAIETHPIEGQSIPSFILPNLISKQQLEVVEFLGERYSVETPHDLETIKRINQAYQSGQSFPDSK
jgi:NDP-sugar pyrophosphorylase family protein